VSTRINQKKPKNNDLVSIEAIGHNNVITTTNLVEQKINKFEKTWRVERGTPLFLATAQEILIGYVINVYILEIYNNLLIYKLLIGTEIHYIAECDAVISLL